MAQARTLAACDCRQAQAAGMWLGPLAWGRIHLPCSPCHAQVFDAALEGGGAKNINFQELAADLAQITFDYPFRSGQAPRATRGGPVCCSLRPARRARLPASSIEPAAWHTPELCSADPVSRLLLPCLSPRPPQDSTLLCTHHPRHRRARGHCPGEAACGAPAAPLVRPAPMCRSPLLRARRSTWPLLPLTGG